MTVKMQLPNIDLDSPLATPGIQKCSRAASGNMRTFLIASPAARLFHYIWMV